MNDIRDERARAAERRFGNGDQPSFHRGIQKEASVPARPRSTATRATSARDVATSLWAHKKPLAVVAALVIYMWVSKPPSPFADGAIPAAKRAPSEHWDAILRWRAFTREMTSHSRLVPKSRWWRGGRKSFSEEIEGHDTGGEDGHEPEALSTSIGDKGGHSAAESMAVTRCTSTRFAVTAYFCGLDIAHNLDKDNAEVATKIVGQAGVEDAIDALKKALSQLHAVGRATGEHKRFVYRLGVGSEDGKAGYAHVWNIVAQPDGTFLWLQSFINQYSLPTWMKQSDSRDERHLLFDTILHKLELIRKLMRIDKWDAEANDAYLAVFNVDMNLARGAKGERLSRQRLQSFSWDIACEYPTPKSKGMDIMDPWIHEGSIMARAARHLYQQADDK